ncbi:MAG: ADP-ribosylation factor-like protein [Candidatus Helarchaeota archaeon]
MTRYKQKIVFFGPSNAGKTSLQKFFWEKKTYDEIKDLPPTKSYDYSDRPLRFGPIEISSLDLGGQSSLIKQWLDDDAEFRCFEHANVVICVLDFSDELLGKSNFLQKMEEIKQLLRLLIASLRVQVLQYQDVDLLIFLHKWDRVVEIKKNEQDLRELIISNLKQIEKEENFENILTEGKKNSKYEKILPFSINFRGFHFTSIKDLRFSPRLALKKVLPRTSQFVIACNQFRRNFLKLSQFFSLFLIDQNLLDIESVQFPVLHDFESIKQFTFRTLLSCFDLETVTYVVVRQENGLGPLDIFLLRVNPDIYCLLVAKTTSQDKTLQLLLEFRRSIQAIDLIYE